jgi:hypothetical protein
MVDFLLLFIAIFLAGITYEIIAYIVSQWRMKHFDDSHWFEVDLPDGTTKRVKGADRRAFYLALNKDATPSNQVSIK